MINFPNLLTAIRLALTPLIALALLDGKYGRALVLFFVAGVSDAFDGFLARKLGETTRFGAYLDPVADKILLASIYLSLGFAGAMPWWMVGIVFGRDLLILSMVAWGLLFTSVRRFPPSIWGKISTFLQILAALLAMGDRYGIAVPKTPRALANDRGDDLERDSLRVAGPAVVAPGEELTETGYFPAALDRAEP